MIAKLISNPLVSNQLPEGMTLHKDYEVVEVFYSNHCDKYFRVIDDNGNEQAWNSDLFEVIVKRPVDILKDCIYELENMSQEEFDKTIKEKGINNKEYLIEKYTDDSFHIVLPCNKKVSDD